MQEGATCGMHVTNGTYNLCMWHAAESSRQDRKQDSRAVDWAGSTRQEMDSRAVDQAKERIGVAFRQGMGLICGMPVDQGSWVKAPLCLNTAVGYTVIIPLQAGGMNCIFSRDGGDLVICRPH